MSSVLTENNLEDYNRGCAFTAAEIIHFLEIELEKCQHHLDECYARADKEMDPKCREYNDNCIAYAQGMVNAISNAILLVKRSYKLER